MSKKLSEQLAKERAKASLQGKGNQKKRPAEDVSAAEVSSADGPADESAQLPDKKSKRTKHAKPKGKS